MTSRRIAFYMHDLAGGGVERMRLALIEQLRAQGEDVTLVLGSATGPLTPLVPAALPVAVLGRHGMLGAVWPLARFLSRNRPDVLVASLDHNNITAILARIVARVPTRVVICQHNALSAERAMGWRYRAVPWLYWLLHRGAAGIVAVSRGVADDLAATAGIPRARITPIYNPVIGPDFADRAKGPAPHDWLADRSCPVFVFAGRLTEQKDPAMLLQAFALLLPRHPARLIFLGDGPLLVGLRVQAASLGLADYVSFPGFQTNPLPWVRHATALVSTSRYEGLGNAIIEALACGTPVITTDCPHGPSEIVLAGSVGRLVPVGDPVFLADAMLAQIYDRPDTAALRARAASFTAEACADAHQALFDTLLAKPPANLTFGLRLSALRADGVVARIIGDPATDGVRLVVTPNLDHIRLLRRPDFATAYRSAELICPDGFPVLLYARLRGLKLSTRVTGCELFHLLARQVATGSFRIFFVVESSATADALSEWSSCLGISDRVRMAVAPQGLAVNPRGQAALADTIREAGASILVMTLGAPVSEIFVDRHRDRLPPCWALCVGQAVRVELGLVRRAPPLWRGLGLEWLWRIRHEPHRLIGRYVRSAAWFPFAILRDVLGLGLTTAGRRDEVSGMTS